MFRSSLGVVLLACSMVAPAQGATFHLSGLIGLGDDSMSFDAYDLNYDNRITTEEVFRFSGTVYNGARVGVLMSGTSLPDLLEYNLDGILFDQLNEVVAYTADTRQITCNRSDGGTDLIEMEGNAAYRFDPNYDAVGLTGNYQGIYYDPATDGPLGDSCDELNQRFYSTGLSSFFWGPVRVGMTGDLYAPDVKPVPLPASLPLLGLGLAALWWRPRRRY